MAFKLPGFGGKKTNIKGDMDRKYGHGDFASKEKRMKPGESKFNYDVRMRKQRSKTADKPVTRTLEQLEGIDPKSEIEGTFSTAETYTVDTGDLRDTSKPQNFGSIPGMTFGEAFAQAGKGGAKAGTDPFSWTNPKTGEEKSFLYEFKKGDGPPPPPPPPPSPSPTDTPPPLTELEKDKRYLNFLANSITELQEKLNSSNLSVMERGKIMNKINHYTRLQAEKNNVK